MSNTCSVGMGCCLTSIGIFLLWWFLASAFFLMTWNRVVAVVFKIKTIKLPDAILVLALFSLFSLPSWYVKARMKPSGMSCCHGKFSEGKEDCPYMRKHFQDSKEDKIEEDDKRNEKRALHKDEE
jgi:hypothetical protein